MKRFFRILACLCLPLAVLLPEFVSAQAQFKYYYDIDTNTIQEPFLYEAAELIETGIPGQEIAIGGAVNGNDSANVARQAAYLMQVGYNGVSQQFDFFEDQAYFLIYGPRTYSLCYDGTSNFYMALGSNDNQIVMKVGQDGAYKWSTALNHHAFYSIKKEGDGVVVMGQDESVIGIHDYSLARIDSAGTATMGMMFGTTEFDVPEKMINTSDGYVMCGYTFSAGLFNPMIIKSSKTYGKIWSQIITVPNKDILCSDISEAADGSGYLITGNVVTLQGGPDSIFVMKLDTGGTLLWSNFYGLDSVDNFKTRGIATDPNGRGYLVAGFYKNSSTYSQPFIMKTDVDGNPDWTRNYGIRDTLYDEVFRDVIVRENGAAFFGLGESVRIDTNNMITKRIFMVKASVDSGATPCDSLVSVGVRPAITVPGGGTHTEPFFANNMYSFVSSPGAVNYEVACSMFVSVDVPEPAPNFFSFVNPASNELVLDYTVDIGQGTLKLMDIHGRILREFPLSEGHHRERHALNGLAQGLYFLVGEGEYWRTAAKRLVIAR